MKEFIEYLIKNLVDQPDGVLVDLKTENEALLVQVRVAPTDIAKLIGRQGKTINALRTIAMTIGARFGQKIRIDLLQEK